MMLNNKFKLPISSIRVKLSPNSDAMQEVIAGKRVNSMVVSIFPKWDNHVVHENRSYLEGAKNIELDVTGHHKILFDPRLIETIEGELKPTHQTKNTP